jgi:hypothetical protein
MKTILLTVISLVLTVCVFATSQSSDKIIYKGQEYLLNTNPLESFFEKHPNLRPESKIISSSLWRSYVATFEIQDNQLFVKDIVIMDDDTITGSNKTIWRSVFNHVFPTKKQTQLDWFTGLLVLPYGKLVNYVHMGYASTYENYILLEIDKGNLIQEKNMKSKEYEKFKEKQFKAFQKTEEYKKVKDELKKNGSGTDEFLDSFLKIYVIDYSTKILTK